MQLFRDAEALRAFRNSLETKTTIGFVPTMGALHAGHEALIRKSVAENTVTVVSIFVNPLQFGPNEDLSRYPRPFERDLEICGNLGVTAVFSPQEGRFYAPDHSTWVEVQGLDRHLCGASRPGHFRGVCTVVLKLFNLVGPTRAYFGQKDIQQALILKRMVRDLSVPVDLQIAPTVREEDGLAFSSRNVYLEPDERQRALALSEGLRLAKKAYQEGERSSSVLKALVEESVLSSHPTRVDYIEVVSQESLAPVESVTGPSVIAVALCYGRTRLIDNFLLIPETAP